MKRFTTIILSLAVILSASAFAAPKKAKSKKKAEPVAEKVEEPRIPQPVFDAVDSTKHNMAKNMLERVEKITLIDTLHVDSADFFKYYKLSADAGSLLDASALPQKLRGDNPHMVYRTEDGRELFWAQKKGNALVVVSSDVLDDGHVSAPRPIGPELNDGGGSSDYPFVMQDGLTIYFANNGANSLGGYDIFMTRRSPEGDVLQPQNIGMPYNSPFNDFMMVIDETRNLGWWASDREQIPGKVTIYVFQPSKIRENYPADIENIQETALLRGAVPTGGLDAFIVDTYTAVQPAAEDFYIVAGGKVCTNSSQLRNPQARQAANELVKKEKELAKTNDQLAKLRQRYADGDKKTANEIRSLETRKLQLPNEILQLRNKVVALEQTK